MQTGESRELETRRGRSGWRHGSVGAQDRRGMACGDWGLRVGGGAGLHARRNFLGEEFKQEFGHGERTRSG